MNYRVYALSLFLCSVPTVSGQAAPKARVATKLALPVWKPSAALLSQLDAPVTVGKFQFRPPKGYVLQRQTGPAQMQALGWVGPARANGVRPYLMLIPINVPASAVGKHSAEQILDRFLQSIRKSRGKDWKRTPTEHGTVNGLAFVRAHWSGSVPESLLRLHGFNYVSLMGGQIIQLS